jgi:hypothetical protein
LVICHWSLVIQWRQHFAAAGLVPVERRLIATMSPSQKIDVGLAVAASQCATGTGPVGQTLEGYWAFKTFSERENLLAESV